MIDEVTFTRVHRSLAEPVYLFRLFLIRLTEFDVLLCAVTGVGSWIAFDRMGIARKKFFLGLTLDPYGWIGIALVVALILSLAHKFRPEGQIEQILKGFVAPKQYSPYTRGGDKTWRPSVTRAHLHGKELRFWWK